MRRGKYILVAWSFFLVALVVFVSAGCSSETCNCPAGVGDITLSTFPAAVSGVTADSPCSVAIIQDEIFVSVWHQVRELARFRFNSPMAIPT
jgi:hypothetical protein